MECALYITPYKKKFISQTKNIWNLKEQKIEHTEEEKQITERKKCVNTENKIQQQQNTETL